MILTEHETAEVEANRARYEAAQGAGQQQAPKALPPPTPRDGAPIATDAIIHRETIPGGWYWSTPLNRGEALRIVTRAARPASPCIAWNGADPSERLNHADTVKVQWTTSAAQGPGDLLRHGPRAAVASSRTPAARMTRWPAAPPPRPTPRAMAKAPAQHPRQFHPRRRQARARPPRRASLRRPSSRRSASTPRAGCSWQGERRSAGDFVDLRAEMDLLVALSNCPHPLDPSPDYAPRRRRDRALSGAPCRRDDDLCRTATARSQARLREQRAISRGEGMTMTAIPASARIVLDHNIAAPRAVVGDRPQGPDPAHRRQPRPAGRRHAVLQRRTTSPSATAARTRCARRARPISRPARRSCRPKGDVMLTVTADTCGRHDTSAGACSCESNTVRFGHQTAYLHACRENFLIEVGQARHAQARHRAATSTSS